MTKTVKLNKFTEGNFSIKSHSDLVDVNVIDMETEIITKKDMKRYQLRMKMLFHLMIKMYGR